MVLLILLLALLLLLVAGGHEVVQPVELLLAEHRGEVVHGFSESNQRQHLRKLI